jgi:carbamoyl-phosphate synthase small subunit
VNPRSTPLGGEQSRFQDALLVLADGTVFEGEAAGAPAEVATGEVVFNTVLSGYQEVITDPSYAGQVIAFTYPHIGNYGVTPPDGESARPHCRGVVVRELTRRPSSWRATGDLDGWMRGHGLPAITGVDTRRLTRHIREAGAMPCAFGTADETTLKAAAQAESGTDGADLVAGVTTAEPYVTGDGPLKVVAYDFGIKTSILRQLGEIATVTVVPAATPAHELARYAPDGVFLSNGPGDPAAVTYAIEAIGDLLGQGRGPTRSGGPRRPGGAVPVFGICLGHQLLALALGGRTEKLPFGHHGGNHPVRRVRDDAVEITSQNHNYAVVEGSVASADVTHVNLNDGVIEGLRCRDVPAFSVQYHPEAGPGPHDARYLFQEFRELMVGLRGRNAVARA